MTAVLLPNGKQSYATSTGAPLVGGKIFTYDSGTLNPRTTWQDAGQIATNTNPVILDARGEATIFWSGAYRVIVQDSLGNVVIPAIDGISDANYQDVQLRADLLDATSAVKGADLVGFDASVAYTGQSVGGFLESIYKRTLAEISASVTPTNYWYPPGYVDRYVTNTVPGTTDCAAGFSAAAQVANLLGCMVRWGITAPYRCNSPINCTGISGVIFNDESGADASAGVPSVIIAHTGHGFDLATSRECTFNNVVATNLAGTVPKTLFFMARNNVGSGAGVHRFNNVRTPSACTFTQISYGYGSEENVWTNCFIYNNQPGSYVHNHNQTNPSAYTSTFVTIAAGAQSNAGHWHKSCSYFNSGNSGAANEAVFAVENASNFEFDTGLWYCPHGLCYLRVGGTAASNWITVRAVRGEPDATHPTYGVEVVSTGTTGVNAHSNWIFEQVGSDATNELLHFADTAEIANLRTLVCTPTSGKLLSVYLMQKSIIEHINGIISCRAGGTVQMCTFIGARSNITFSGTDSLNTGFDQALGEAWATNDRYTAASTACTGALTTAVIWKLVKTSQQVTLTLPATVGACSAASNFVYGVVLPTTYRPAADLWFPCVIQNNAATVNQPGLIQISASTGAITVFRDMIGTNFTAAVGGLQTATGVSWRL